MACPGCGWEGSEGLEALRRANGRLEDAEKQVGYQPLEFVELKAVVALAAAGRTACLRSPAKRLERLRGLRPGKRQP